MKLSGLLLASILSINGSIAYSQNVEFLRDPVGPMPKVGGNAQFHYIEKGLDTALLAYVGRVKISAQERPSLMALYRRLESVSKKAGANAFQLVSFDASVVTIVADLYAMSDDMVDRNNMLKPMNTVFVFAGDLYDKTSHDAFEFNGTVQNLRNGTYFSYTLNEGEKAKLKKGTVTGTTMWITWKPNQLPSYYSIRDYGKKNVVKRTTVSQAARPGKFVRVEPALGAMLRTVTDPTR